MTPSSAPVAARRDAARRAQRRRTAVRRRRLLVVLVSGGLLALAVLALTPTVKRAVSDFTLPLAYPDVIREQAADKHLDPALVAAVIYAETKFEPRASSAGAEGLMQIMPQTAQYLARRSGATSFTSSDLATPEVNIAYGSYYLRYLLDHYGGSELPAVAAYNGGIANVDRWVTAAHARGHALGVSDIPFPETQAYVLKVLHAQRAYRQKYPAQLGYE